VKRRAFITMVSGAAATWPLAARAQQPRRVGVLMGGPATDSVVQAYVAAFGLALRQLGWIEGQNLRVDVRWNAGSATLAQTYAAQLIGLQAEVILAATTANLEASGKPPARYQWCLCRSPIRWRKDSWRI
jgi:putative tryptophan/tyrosine transport system substrate-binding protein